MTFIDIHNADEVMTHIQHAEEVLRRHVEAPRRIQQALLGVHYSGGGEGATVDDLERMLSGFDDPDAHHYEMASRLYAEMVYNADKWAVRSRAGDARRAYLIGLERGLNRWGSAQHPLGVSGRQAIDYLSGWCSSVLTMSSNDQLDPTIRRDEPRSMIEGSTLIADSSPIQEVRGAWPRHVRKEMGDVLWDMTAASWEDRLWSANRVVIDIRTVESWMKGDPDLGWDLDALRSLRRNEGFGLTPSDTKRDGRNASNLDQFRQLVEVFEVWFPDKRHPDADNWEEELGHPVYGTIATYAGKEDGGMAVRESRPYVGPRTGPHKISGMWWIGENKVPVAHGVAIDGQVRDLNKIARAIRRGGESYKRFILYDPKIGNKVEALKAGGDNMLVPYEGLLREGKPAVVSLEMGGITDQMLRWYDIARQRLDRVSGHTDVDSGKAVRGNTATGDSLAAQGNRARRAGAMLGWYGHKDWLGYSAGWYLLNDEGVVFSMEPEDAELVAKELGLDQPGTLDADVGMDMGLSPEEVAQAFAWIPGDTLHYRGGTGAVDLDELAVGFEVSGQGFRGEEQRQADAQAAVAQLVSLLPSIQAAPQGVKWAEVLEVLGRVSEIPGFDRLVNFEELGASAPLPGIELAGASGNGRGGPPNVINLSGVQAKSTPKRPEAAPAAQTQEGTE